MRNRPDSHTGWRFAAALVSLVALGALPGAAKAQSDASLPPIDPKIADKKVTLNVESVRLSNAIRLLMTSVGADYIIDNALKNATITVSVSDMPFDKALKTVLGASSLPLTYTVEDGIFHFKLRTEPEPKETPPDPPEPKPEAPQFTKIKVNNIKASQLARMLGATAFNLETPRDNALEPNDPNLPLGQGSVSGYRSYSVNGFNANGPFSSNYYLPFDSSQRNSQGYFNSFGLFGNGNFRVNLGGSNGRGGRRR